MNPGSIPGRVASFPFIGDGYLLLDANGIRLAMHVTAANGQEPIRLLTLVNEMPPVADLAGRTLFSQQRFQQNCLRQSIQLDDRRVTYSAVSAPICRRDIWTRERSRLTMEKTKAASTGSNCNPSLNLLQRMSVKQGENPWIRLH